MLTTYTQLFRIKGAWQFSGAGFLARMPIAMNALGIILLVSLTTGSYALAGLTSGAYTLTAAVVSPYSSRLIDRFGQRRVLLPLGLLDALSLWLIALVAILHVPAALVIVVAILAGATHPNIGSLVRARWVGLLSGDTRLRTAFAWESVLDEFIFTIGPVITTFLALNVAPASPLIVAGAITAVGVLLLVAQHHTEPATHAHAHAAGKGALRYRGMIVMFIAAAGLGGLFGSYEVSVVAATAEWGDEVWTGWVLALWAGSSMLAGLVFGVRHPKLSFAKLLPITTGIGVIVVAFAHFAPNTALLALAAFAAGLIVAPSLICLFGNVETLVPTSRLTEGLTWANSGIAVGFALGGAFAGQVIDSMGAATAFWLPVASIALAFVASAAGLSRTQHAKMSPEHHEGEI